MRPPPRSHTGMVVWFTGLSGAGKTTLATAVCQHLLDLGFAAQVLDSEVLRSGPHRDLDFTPQGRDQNVRRLAALAEIFAREGAIVLVAAISPYRATRQEIRTLSPSFAEVYVNTPLAVCEQRDPKGHYRRARVGALPGFTGIDAPYQAPLTPEIECQTPTEPVEESVRRIVACILPRILPN